MYSGRQYHYCALWGFCSFLLSLSSLSHTFADVVEKNMKEEEKEMALQRGLEMALSLFACLRTRLQYENQQSVKEEMTIKSY